MAYFGTILIEEDVADTSSPAHWDIARDLQENPDRVLYPTDDFITWMNHGNSKGLERHTGQDLYREPIKVGVAKKKWMSRMVHDEDRRTKILESLAFERWIASYLLDDSLTLDPREAAMSIRDKYTGPKE